jgi:hypothetical protein
VSGPSGVSNSCMRIERLFEVDTGFANQGFQFGNLSYLLKGKNLVLLVTVDGEPRRVVPTVLEPGETLGRMSQGTRKLIQMRKLTIDQSVDDVFAVFFNQVVDVAKNTTVERLGVSNACTGINWQSEKRTTCLQAVIETNERIREVARVEKQHKRAREDVEAETRGLGSEGHRRR